MPSHVGQVIMSTTLDTAAKVKAIYGGTWEAWGKGKVPVGVDPNDTDFNAPNKSGGAKTVTLETNQIPSHSHDFVINIQHSDGTRVSGEALTSGLQVSGRARYFGTTKTAGDSQAHENMPPFMTLYMWQRIS